MVWSLPDAQTSYNTGPTVVALPIRPAFSHMSLKISGSPMVICVCVCASTQIPLRRCQNYFFARCWETRGFRSGDGFTVAVAVASGLLDLDSLLLKVSLTFGDISFWTDLVWATIDLVWTLTTPC